MRKPKYVLVNAHRGVNNRLTVHAVYGPYKSREKAVEAKKKLHFAYPEQVYIANLWRK